MTNRLDKNILSHHANCLVSLSAEGVGAARLALIAALESEAGIAAAGNADFHDRTFDVMTVADARELKAQALLRPVRGDGPKIFVFAANGMTHEAQNALLKLLEEPPAYARFFMILPSAHILLPTVRSRLNFLEWGSGRADHPDHDASVAGGSAAVDAAKNAGEEMFLLTAKFLRAGAPARLEMAKKLADEIAKEKRSKVAAVSFLDNVERIVRAEKGVRGGFGVLEAIENARRHVYDRAPSIKMLLDTVALAD